jgi:DNA-binding PadR family transcriptional regulator
MAWGRIESVPPSIVRSAHDGSSDADDPTVEPLRPVPLSDLSAFRRDLLLVVASFEGTDTVPAGVAIAEDLRAASAGLVSQGRFYQNLRELVAEGFVEKRPIDGRTNAYYLPSSTAEALATRVAWEQRCLATDEYPDRERDSAADETETGSSLLGRWR